MLGGRWEGVRTFKEDSMSIHLNISKWVCAPPAFVCDTVEQAFLVFFTVPFLRYCCTERVGTYEKLYLFQIHW